MKKYFAIALVVLSLFASAESCNNPADDGGVIVRMLCDKTEETTDAFCPGQN